MLIRRSLKKDKSILFTDSPDLARQQILAGEAVVGICYPESEGKNWFGISYLMEIESKEELNELEDWYVQEVWCRYHRQPIVIGRFEAASLKQTYCLREITLRDVENLYPLYEDEAIKRWISPLDSEIYVEKAKVASYIKNVYELYGCGMWILEEERTGKIVGRVGVEPQQEEEGFFLGYMIAKSERRHHLAESACQIALNYAEKRLELDGVWCKIAEENVPSIHLAKKLGFVLQEKAQGQLLFFREVC